MKKSFWLIFSIFAVMSLNSLGQTVSVEKYYYAEVLQVTSSGKMETVISFGAKNIFPVENKEEIVKKITECIEPTDIMNYMGDYGWEYVDNSIQLKIINDGRTISTTVYRHYFFKKKR